MNWNQPICCQCYAERNPGREPVRLRHPNEERCCLCGKPTTCGIYIRANPTTVPFPTRPS